MLRSSIYLRELLRLRRAAEESRLRALDGQPLPETDPFDYYAHRRATARIRELEAELAEAQAASEALDFEFDGRDVYGSSIMFRRLEKLIPPVGRTLRWTARDQAMLDGDEPVPGTDLASLAEPVLAAAFAGSFGLRVTRSPVPEQGQMLRAPLFDRAAERVVGLFRVANETRERVPVVRSLDGLRSNAVSAFRDLSIEMARSSVTTRLRWQGEDVIPVTPSVANLIVDALSDFHVQEEQLLLFGTLTGADLQDEKFHLIVEENGRQRDYRGKAEPDVVASLRAIRFGSRVRASVTVVEQQTELVTRAKPLYVLTAVEEITPATA